MPPPPDVLRRLRVISASSAVPVHVLNTPVLHRVNTFRKELCFYIFFSFYSAIFSTLQFGAQCNACDLNFLISVKMAYRGATCTSNARFLFG